MCRIPSVVLICNIVIDPMSRVIALSLPITQDGGTTLVSFPFLRMKELRGREDKLFVHRHPRSSKWWVWRFTRFVEPQGLFALVLTVPRCLLSAPRSHSDYTSPLAFTTTRFQGGASPMPHSSESPASSALSPCLGLIIQSVSQYFTSVPSQLPFHLSPKSSAWFLTVLSTHRTVGREIVLIYDLLPILELKLQWVLMLWISKTIWYFKPYEGH